MEKFIMACRKAGLLADGTLSSKKRPAYICWCADNWHPHVYGFAESFLFKRSLNWDNICELKWQNL